MPEERLGEIVGALHKMVEDKGGAIIAEEMPQMRALAYPMPKVIQTKRHMFDHAYFGWMKFEAQPADFAAIKKSIDALDEMLRSLFIKTVRENTLIAGKLAARDAQKQKAEGEASAQTKAPVQEEEIDKSIEALVTN
jgi:ribosomal protein S6